MPLINFSGLASGIDSEALIEATSDATRQARVTPLENQVAEIENESASVDELKTLMIEFQSLVKNFSTLSGGAISKTALSSNESNLSATASKSASLGTYSIDVTQLAENHVYSFDNTFTASSDTPISGGNTGTIDVTIGVPGSSFQINIDSTTTWADIASDFNTATDEATASILQVSPGVYQLAFTSKNTGVQDGSISVAITPTAGTPENDIGPNPPGPGITEDPAVNANFTFSGVNGTLNSTTNIVNDVIPGVTLSLKGITGSAETITVTDDTESTYLNIEEIIDKYNEIVELIGEENLVERIDSGAESTNIFGPLANTRVDDNSLQAIRNSFISSTYSGGTEVRIFADMGITTERDGTLKLDEDTFKEALQKESNSANEILKTFADDVSTTDGVIDQFVRFKGLFDLTTDGNSSLVTSLNDRIARAEESISKTEDLLRQRFARLEGVVGRLQNEQAALSSALAGLG